MALRRFNLTSPSGSFLLLTAILLIRVVSAIIVVIAPPVRRDAGPIRTLELVCFTRAG